MDIIENEEVVKIENRYHYDIDGSRYLSEIIEIMPAMAKSILEKDTFNNRPISKDHVRGLVKEMVSGNWLFDWSPIRFNDKGQLLDGRHRLTAIVASGKTFKFNVISGLDTETFKSMDTGRKREGSDILSISGVNNAKAAAAAIKFVYGFTNNVHGANRDPKRTLSNSDLLHYYDVLNEYYIHS